MVPIEFESNYRARSTAAAVVAAARLGVTAARLASAIARVAALECGKRETNPGFNKASKNPVMRQKQTALFLPCTRHHRRRHSRNQRSCTSHRTERVIKSNIRGRGKRRDNRRSNQDASHQRTTTYATARPAGASAATAAVLVAASAAAVVAAARLGVTAARLASAIARVATLVAKQRHQKKGSNSKKIAIHPPRMHKNNLSSNPHRARGTTGATAVAGAAGARRAALEWNNRKGWWWSGKRGE